MSTLEMTLRDYLAEVAAPTPSCTGGSVCAMTIAAAAGLVGMTARLSTTLDDSTELAALADGLRDRAGMLATADTAAYSAVCSAQRLARDSPERSRAIRDALVAAAQPPRRMVHLAAEAASLAALLAAHGKEAARGDAMVAANLAAAAARGAAELVRINLAGAGVEPPCDADVGRAVESADRSARLARSGVP